MRPPIGQLPKIRGGLFVYTAALTRGRFNQNHSGVRHALQPDSLSRGAQGIRPRQSESLTWIAAGMATHVTTSLAEQFAELGEDPAEFAEVFDAWTRRCIVDPDAEFESRLFGKDGAYASPKVGGEKYLLRHVHLLPIKELEKIPRWLAVLKNKAEAFLHDRSIVA